MKLNIGDQAPIFELPDQNGKIRELSAYRGKKVLLYFYPKDFTLGCTTEACSLRDNFPKFDGVWVLGISTDSVVSHRKFADKYNLPFTLLADTEKTVVKLYGVYKPRKFLGKEFLGTLRTSFLIDEKGKIENIYENVKPSDHTKQILNDLG